MRQEDPAPPALQWSPQERAAASKSRLTHLFRERERMNAALDIAKARVAMLVAELQQAHLELRETGEDIQACTAEIEQLQNELVELREQVEPYSCYVGCELGPEGHHLDGCPNAPEAPA